jgi:ABC-type Fe3+-hydroxamate transport system substrate-binding protein
MDFVEKLAEKIIPTLMIAVILSMFKMYMDVGELKRIAKDYKDRADKILEEHSSETRLNREALIRLGERK